MFGFEESREEKQQSSRGKKPVKVDSEFHSELQKVQREFKRQRGVEPTLGELVEELAEEDPVFHELAGEKGREEQQDEGLLSDEFMKL